MTALGIAPYVDVLVTTNDIGKLKIDGFFGRVLQRFQIKIDEIVFIGDSATRDVAPARMGGIWSWPYDEKDNCEFEVEAPRINSLMKMKYILGGRIDRTEAVLLLRYLTNTADQLHDQSISIVATCRQKLNAM